MFCMTLYTALHRNMRKTIKGSVQKSYPQILKANDITPLLVTGRFWDKHSHANGRNRLCGFKCENAEV